MPEESLSAIFAAGSSAKETKDFIKQVRGTTKHKFTPEEKLRMVPGGFRHEVEHYLISQLCNSRF